MTASWSGDEWQDYCRELLAARHGALYQPVPDSVAGDWGVEGFTAEGTVYQCYAPEEPLTSRLLYDKHRHKMTADLGKLRKNLSDIAALIAPSTIKCWVLLVPRVEDKAILQHAAAKARELRDLNNASISDEFVVRVHTAADFPTECRLLDESLALIVPAIEVGSDSDIARHVGNLELGLEALDGKISRLLGDSDEANLVQLRKEILRLYVGGRQLDDWVRRHHPALWERWQHSREGIKRTLKMSELTASEPPNARLKSVLGDLEESAGSAVPTMMHSDTTSLAWGTITDWLIECPLDFAGTANG